MCVYVVCGSKGGLETNVLLSTRRPPPIRLECGAGDLGIVTRLGFQCQDQLALHEPGDLTLSIRTDMGDTPQTDILLAIEAFARNRSSVLD